jgi:hypothetical protein
MFDLFFNRPYNALMDAIRNFTFSARSAAASSMSGVPVATIAFMSVAAGASLAMIVGNAESDASSAPEPAAVAYRDDEPEEDERYDDEYMDRGDDDDRTDTQRGGCGVCGDADQAGGGKRAGARRTRGARVRARSTRRR